MSIFKKIFILFIISGSFIVFIGLFANNINEKKEEILEKKKFIDIAKEIIIAVDNPIDIKNIYEKYNLLDLNPKIFKISNIIYEKLIVLVLSKFTKIMRI